MASKAMSHPLRHFLLQRLILFGLLYSKTSVVAACSLNSGIFSAATGSISNVDYQSFENCNWIIAVPGTTITLTFTSFDTERDYDYLHVYSCTSYDCSLGLSELHGSPFTGSSIPRPIISTTGYMQLTFISDSSNDGPGFIATYSTSTATCPGTTSVLTATSGTISARADNYGANANCNWIITVPGTTITLNFTRFYTTNDDFLHAYSCTSSNCSSGLSELHGSPFTGLSIPSPIISTTGYMQLTFISDGFNNEPGFIATYFTSPSICPGNTSVLTATSGTISASTGNNGANQNCDWIIAAPGTPIKLTFTSLQIDGINNTVQAFSCLTSPCSSPIELPGSPFSGPSLPNPLSSTTGYMKVIFVKSYSSLVSSGFNATYSTGSSCPGSGLILSRGSGVISYSQYTSWIACTWIIAAPNMTISLAFDALDADTNHDKLWVYICESSKCVSPSLLQGNPFGGPGLPDPVYSNTGYMMIGFTSDGFSTTSYPGFNLTYSTSAPGSTYCNKYSFVVQGGLCAGLQVDASLCSFSQREMQAAQANLSGMTNQSCIQQVNPVCALLSGNVKSNACDNGGSFCKYLTQYEFCQADADCSGESAFLLPCCYFNEILSLCDNLDSSKLATLTSKLPELGLCKNDDPDACLQVATSNQPKNILSASEQWIVIAVGVFLLISFVFVTAWKRGVFQFKKPATSTSAAPNVAAAFVDAQMVEIHPRATVIKTTDGDANLSRIIANPARLRASAANSVPTQAGGSGCHGNYSTSVLRQFSATAPDDTV